MPSEQPLHDRSNELLGGARRLNVLMIAIWCRILWAVCNSRHVNSFGHRDRPPTPPLPNFLNNLHCDYDLGVAAIAHPDPSLCNATLFKSWSQRGLTGWWGDRQYHQNPVPSDPFQMLCIDDALGDGTSATRPQGRPTKSGRGLTFELSWHQRRGAPGLSLSEGLGLSDAGHEVLISVLPGDEQGGLSSPLNLEPEALVQRYGSVVGCVNSQFEAHKTDP
jgi:hypothetical protein